MTIELATVVSVAKPWGRQDLRPFARNRSGEPVGELWFTRAADAPRTALLPKLLFTAEPVSIQVHPTDDHAASRGEPHGKAETWLVLDAAPGSKVAVGLRRPLRPAALRSAIEDGSIAGQIAWRPAAKDDAVAVPAGTIHAIGAGLVLAEISQNSEAAFRLFDFGRGRPLHPDDAVISADAGPAQPAAPPVRVGTARTMLVAQAGFVVERVVLPPHTSWALEANQETWLLVLAGSAQAGDLRVGPGQALFLDGDTAGLEVGNSDLVALLAYVAREPDGTLLREDRGGPSSHADAAA